MHACRVEDTETQQKFEWQKGNPEKWMPSFAASMTAAYCIGARDRHSRNILVQTTTKRVFQIDFGAFVSIFCESLPCLHELTTRLRDSVYLGRASRRRPWRGSGTALLQRRVACNDAGAEPPFSIVRVAVV